MKNYSYILFFIFSFCSSTLFAQLGCPGCMVELPSLPEDTIFLSTAPDGVAGVYYDEDLSFRMPKTTDPVHANDPSTPAGLTLDKVTILAVANVPPGISWEANKTEFDPSQETDGCVKFCGTPLQPGFFEVEVIVEAKISLLSQTASFSFELYIAPASSSTEGFSMTNSAGCGDVVVAFENNIPSNGLDGFSYNWNFGNGFTSNLENPGAQVYTEPGIYEVQYEALIDTIGSILTSVTLLDVDCDDLIGDPDVFIRIKDSNDNTIFSTDPINNTPIPITINVNIPLGTGTYKLEVKDDDPLGTADCGSVTFNLATTDTLSSGGLEVFFTTFSPVFSVTSVDTVEVFAEPAIPLITPSEVDPLCSGQQLDLMASYDENIQWYRDTNLLFQETNAFLTVSEAGDYWVEYTSDDGCRVQSEPVFIEFNPSPASPVFLIDNNLLFINNTSNLPDDYSLTWLLEGNLLEGETDTIYCANENGLYTAQVIDNETGCTNSFSFFVSVNPELSCFSSTEELPLEEQSLVVYPNPSSGQFQLNFELDQLKEVSYTIRDLTGRTVVPTTTLKSIGAVVQTLDLINHPNGVYLLQIQIGDNWLMRRLVKQ